YQGRGTADANSVLEFMQYPGGMNAGLLVLSSIGGLMGIVFMANIIGSEYSRDTWKMILPRRGSRLSFLWTKLAMTFFAIIFLMVVSLIVAQLFGFIAAFVLGADLTASGGTTFKNIWFSGVYTFMQIGFSAMLTLFVTVVTRSTIGGIVGGFVASQIFGVATLLSKIAALILPNMHLQNIFGTWVITDPEAQAGIQAQVLASMGREVSPMISLLVVSAYIIVFIASAAWLFKKRDMAGQ
ncbi:MAG: ABC transporter permease, partial [Herpetosiphon sp.]|nr:ABC transporter permease [Herpetosiphon sp.]